MLPMSAHGSIASVSGCSRGVCFTPNSGHLLLTTNSRPIMWLPSSSYQSEFVPSNKCSGAPHTPQLRLVAFVGSSRLSGPPRAPLGVLLCATGAVGFLASAGGPTFARHGLGRCLVVIGSGMKRASEIRRLHDARSHRHDTPRENVPIQNHTAFAGSDVKPLICTSEIST